MILVRFFHHSAFISWHSAVRDGVLGVLSLLLLTCVCVSKDAVLFQSMAHCHYYGCSFRLTLLHGVWFLFPWTCPHQSTSLLPRIRHPLSAIIWIFGTGQSFVVRACPGPCGMLSGISGLYRPDAHLHIHTHTCCDNRSVSDTARSPLGGAKSTPPSPHWAPLRKPRSNSFSEFHGQLESQFLQYIRQEKPYNVLYFL